MQRTFSRSLLQEASRVALAHAAQIARLRDALMGHLKWKRMIEPVALALIYTTGAMVLPLFFPCTPTECVVTTAVSDGASHIPR